mgnify:FL=1
MIPLCLETVPTHYGIDVRLFTHGPQNTNMVPHIHFVIRTGFRYPFFLSAEVIDRIKIAILFLEILEPLVHYWITGCVRPKRPVFIRRPLRQGFVKE